MSRRGPEPRRVGGARLAVLAGGAAAVALAAVAAVLLPDYLLLVLPWGLRGWLAEARPYWAVPVAVTLLAWWRGRPVGLADPVGRRDVPAAAACATVGVLLFIVPDLVWWGRTGEFVWVRDNDDVLYLAVASQAYFNHPFRLADPTRASGGLPLYSWLPCGPGILTAWALGLGPVGIGLAWRVLAGASIPLSWYLLLRRYVGPAAVTAVVVVLLTADIGSMFGAPLEWQVSLLRRLGRGELSWLKTAYRPPGVQWRMATPGLIFIYLAAYLALLLRAQAGPTRARVAAAGAAFGALFYVYFYYWTAAALGLGLGFVADRGRRGMYLGVLAVGVLVGLPSLLSGSETRRVAAEAFVRFDLFRPVAREVMPALGSRESCLLAACFVWVAWRRRDLLPVATAAAAGWLLTNHQVVSGFVTQNDHWRLHVVGPLLTLLQVLIVFGWVSRLTGRSRRVALGVVAAAAALDLAGGFALRERVATAATEPLKRIRAQLCYRAQRECHGAPRLAPNAVVAGDEAFVNWATILENQRPLFSNFITRHSLTVGHDEWNERAALNGYVLGRDRAGFATEQRARIANDFWGPWVRNPEGAGRLLAERMTAYDAVAADPVAALERFGVRYAGLPPGASPPAASACGWRLLEAGPSWWVWERRPAPGRGGGRGAGRSRRAPSAHFRGRRGWSSTLR